MSLIRPLAETARSVPGTPPSGEVQNRLDAVVMDTSIFALSEKREPYFAGGGAGGGTSDEAMSATAFQDPSGSFR